MWSDGALVGPDCKGIDSKRTCLERDRVKESARQSFLCSAPQGHDRKMSSLSVKLNCVIELDARTPSDEGLR